MSTIRSMVADVGRWASATFDGRDILTAIGTVAAAYGLREVYPPAAWIFIGVLLLTMALLPPTVDLLASLRRRER